MARITYVRYRSAIMEAMASAGVDVADQGIVALVEAISFDETATLVRLSLGRIRHRYFKTHRAVADFLGTEAAGRLFTHA